MGRPSRKRPAVIERTDRRAVREFLTKGGQHLLPLVELVEQTESAIDEVIDVVGRAAVEAVLDLSAARVAGAKTPGQKSGAIRWYGRQAGSVRLSDRKLRIERPRLRKMGRATGTEVEIPAYRRLREGGLGEHVLKLLMRGVSTRNYEPVLTAMAGTAGVSKSAISREWIEVSSRQLEALQSRRLEEWDILIVYLDGMVFGAHHVLAAVGVDTTGEKHVLGLAPGSSENHRVAKDLLCGLIDRGLDPQRLRLFIIDGSKPLRRAIREVFGDDNPVQRCRAHKVRNVTERLPKEKRADVKKALRAAFRLETDEGIARLETLALWLERDHHPDAAASLREGLDEMFTLQRLGLPSALTRCLATTNIIESPQGGVRARSQRVTRWRDPAMILRWCGAAFLECEKRFRKIDGYPLLWVLDGKLREIEQRRESPDRAA